MTTTRHNLTKDWLLIGEGAVDLQREDSRETIYLHFGASLPANDTRNHARIVDNSIYQYRGLDKVYARSLDEQAFLVATEIVVSSGGGGSSDATAANQVIANDLLTVLAEPIGSTGVLSGNNQVVDIAFTNKATLSINIAGTYVGGFILEGSADFGVTWHSMDHTQWKNGLANYPVKFHAVIPCGGLTNARLRTDTEGWISGSANITLIGTTAPSEASNLDLLHSQMVDTDAQETIAIGNTSAISTAGTQYTKAILTATKDCWVSMGSAPVAVRDEGIFIPAGTAYYPLRLSENNYQFAVINDVADVTGKLNIVWSY